MAKILTVVIDRKGLQRVHVGGPKMRLDGREPPRMSRNEALRLAWEVIESLKGRVSLACYAGSLRRGKADVGDVDILVVPNPPEVGGDWREALRGPRWEVLADGEVRMLLAERSTGRRVDVVATIQDTWGATLQYITGSREHNVALRSLAKDMGMKLNEKGLYRGDVRIAGEREGEIYAALGVRWTPPSCRSRNLWRVKPMETM